MSLTKIPQVIVFSICALMLSGCNSKPDKNQQPTFQSLARDYIRPIPGENDTIPLEVVQRGEVLIAYSDCYQCHAPAKRAKGPSFQDIAKRYPIREVYLDLLAGKVIHGSTGSWGSPVMDPHPQVSMEDAKTMVTYILSLKEEAVVL